MLPLHQQEQCLAPCGWEHAYLADTGYPGHSGHLTFVKEGCGLLSCPLHKEVVDFVIITHRAVLALPDQHRGHKLSVWGHRARGGDLRPTQNGESLPASVPSQTTQDSRAIPHTCPTLFRAMHSVPQPTRWEGRGHLTIQPVQWGLLRFQCPLVQVPPNVREAPKLVACCCVQASICAGQVPISMALQPEDSPTGHQHPQAPGRQVGGGPSPDLLRPLCVEPPSWHPL